jgi:hypothetical protein
MSVEILSEYKSVFVAVHMLGFVFGLGGATIADIMFFRFLSDLRISKKEHTILASLSQIVWVGLLMLWVSGILIFLGDVERYSASSKFLLKAVVVVVITINGVLLNTIVAPRLMKIDWKLGHNARKRHLRRLACALGGISMVSWYSAFVLGSLRSLPYSFSELLIVYVGMLLLTVIVSQCMEALFAWKRSK